MDIIIIAAGLTILLARDVYRSVRRKRREKKIKKRLLEVGIDPNIYTPAQYAFLTSSSRQYYDYRDHMHRFHHPPPGIPVPRPRTSSGHPDRGVLRRYGEYGRSRTMDGSEYVERLGTPPPPYTPPPRMSSEFTTRSGEPGVSTGGVEGAPDRGHTDPTLPPPSIYPAGELQHLGSPPPFEHAYTADATGMAEEERRKEQGIETIVEYVDRLHPVVGQSTLRPRVSVV